MQVVQPEGLSRGAGTPGEGCTVGPPSINKRSEHQAQAPEASVSGWPHPAAALRAVHGSAQSLASNLSLETCLGLQSMPAFTLNTPFLLSAFLVEFTKSTYTFIYFQFTFHDTDRNSFL